ncbi:hypothetical protein ACFL3V_05350 [Nanoarchaeota archaeon]
MILKKLMRVLDELISDKRAMVPPMPKMPAGGKPGLGSMNPMKTDAGARIEQHKQQVEQLKQAIKQKEEELKPVEQSIDGANSQIDQAKSAEQDTTELDQQLEQLENQKSAIEGEISELKKGVSVEEGTVSMLEGDVSTEKKLNVMGFIPQTKVVAMAGQKAMEMKHDKADAETSDKMQDVQSKVSDAASKAKAAGGAAASKVGAAAGGVAGAGKSAAGKIGGGLKSLTGNAALGKKMMDGGAGSESGDGTQTPIAAVVAVMVSLVGGGWMFTTGGISALPAVIPFILLIIAIVVIVRTRGHRGLVIWLLIILILTAALYMFSTRTAPHAIAAINSGQAEKDAQDAAAAARQGVGSIISDAMSSYRKQIAMASGENIDGDVDKTVKEDVGIEILPPYLPNPKTITELEMGALEIGARIKGFDPKTPITVTTVCNLQTQEDASKISSTITSGKGPKTNLGPIQDKVQPKSMSGHNFNNDVTCYPTVTSCGSYITTISAQADNLRTDGWLYNYIIGKETLDKMLYNYAESKDKELRSEADVSSAIRELFPQIQSFKSKSQKGAIKVVMATQRVPLIGVDSNTQLKLLVGVENMMKGWIRSLNKVEITIDPANLIIPSSSYCTQWDITDNKLTLKKDYLKNANFQLTDKGHQKILPSCLFTPVSAVDFESNEPFKITFTALVDYNYLVQEEYKTEIRDKDNKVCKKKTTGSGSSSTSTGSAPTVKLSTIKSTSEYTGAITPCAGKSTGFSCGSGQFCTTINSKGYCMPQCVHYAKTGQSGLNSSYDCISPAANCKQGTTKQYICKSSHVAGDFTCCIPNS